MAWPAASWRVNGEQMGEGQGECAGGDWRPQRIGLVPSQYSVSARLDVERSILAACGVPVSPVISLIGPMLERAGGGSFMVRYGGRGLVGAELERVGLSGSVRGWCRNGRGVLFWRDAPGPHAPRDPAAARRAAPRASRPWAAVPRGWKSWAYPRVLTETPTNPGSSPYSCYRCPRTRPLRHDATRFLRLGRLGRPRLHAVRGPVGRLRQRQRRRRRLRDDWPLCGELLSPSAGATAADTADTLVEFTHRATSGLALLAVGGLAVWSRRRFPPATARATGPPCRSRSWSSSRSSGPPSSSSSGST